MKDKGKAEGKRERFRMRGEVRMVEGEMKG